MLSHGGAASGARETAAGVEVVPMLREGKVPAEVGVFLNRLSDLLFVMARVANHRAGVPDVKWIPERPGK